MDDDRIARQISFSLEIDKLTGVLRRTYLLDGSRLENSAEHSWHICVMAMMLGEHAPAPINLPHAIRMLLVHDLVEIDAGDTYGYDTTGLSDKLAREIKAAERIFNILPSDQAAQVRALWDEFEAGNTPEARFANAMDRLQPILHNYHTQGRQWRKHGVTSDRIYVRIAPIKEGAPALWTYAKRLIEDAVVKGYIES